MPGKYQDSQLGTVKLASEAPGRCYSVCGLERKRVTNGRVRTPRLRALVVRRYLSRNRNESLGEWKWPKVPRVHVVPPSKTRPSGARWRNAQGVWGGLRGALSRVVQRVGTAWCLLVKFKSHRLES
jgi:hypothetical protein